VTRIVEKAYVPMIDVYIWKVAPEDGKEELILRAEWPIAVPFPCEGESLVLGVERKRYTVLYTLAGLTNPAPPHRGYAFFEIHVEDR
jgi:hypothetical protein